MTPELFQRIADAVPGAMYLMAADMSRYLYLNPPIERMLGYPLSEFLEKGPAFMASLIHPDDIEVLTREHHERVAELSRAGAEAQDRYTHGATYRVRHRDGGWRWIRSSAIVFDRTESGEVLTVLGVAQDITAQRDLESRMRLAERMASLGRLAAGMAHEINNPLAHLVAALDLAVERAESGELAGAELVERLTQMQRSAERVTGIVRELKLFSRPGDEVTLGPVDLEHAFEACLPLAMPELRHRARLVREYAADLPPARANEPRLAQVFVNLLVNAAHAIPEGQSERHEIRLRTALGAIPGEVVAEVRDTGAGMERETLTRAFDPFFTTKPVGQGMGLGLSIAYEIVQSMGGRLEAESQPGKGSVFRVILPCAPALATAPSVRAYESQIAAKSVQRGRILIVDDEPGVSEMLREALAGEHEVVCCNNVTELLNDPARLRGFDLVFCDLTMPQMNGMEFYQAALRIDAALVSRFVFMTGGAFTAQVRDFLDKTANPVLHKPFRLHAVRSLARDIIQRLN